MPSITRPARQTDYALVPRECPLVIDNGSFSFRIGWAGEVEPRLVFRNGVHKLRHKASGETVNVIGDFDHGLMKFFESGRSNFRSAFDGNVVYQFEYMEYILDYAFERMGAEEQVGHPILMTECLCNPNQSRSKMAELLFETYDIPSIAFGIDAAFSYNYNQQLGNCDDDGLVVYAGHNTSHAIPVLRGEPVMEACCRTNIGGSHITEYMNKLLLLQYPYHRDSITMEKAEELKKEHCYVAEDYSSELQIFQKASKEAEEKTRYWQLPWVPPPQEKVITEEELARKAAIKEKQGQRLREMAAAKRSSKIAELESEIEGFEQLLQQLDYSDDQADLFSTENGFGSRQEIETALAKSMTSLRKLKGEPTEVEKEKEDVAMEERYPLINIPNSMLTSEQIKEKKRQLFLKTTSEGRAKAKQKRHEEELQRERENQQDEERRLENPELYLEKLRAKQAELAAKVEQRKRLKVNGFPHTNNNGTVTGGVGRGERLNAAQRERMRLLTTAAFDRGKGEDTFGQKDEDWQLYKKMSKDNDDDDDNTPDQDEAELARLNARLQELDPTFILPLADTTGSQPTLEVQQPRPLTADDFRITLGVERFRCPEILFQPHMIGIDQAGLDEMVGISARRLPSHSANAAMNGTILLTGGTSLLPGLDARLQAEIQKIRPLGSTVRLVRASDPLLDAWRGASHYAASSLFSVYSFTRQDFMEKGEDWLRKYKLSYSFGA